MSARKMPTACTQLVSSRMAMPLFSTPGQSGWPSGGCDDVSTYSYKSWVGMLTSVFALSMVAV